MQHKKQRTTWPDDACRGNGTMKDLQRFYMQLASSLELRWTSQQDKRHAAILLRNAAIETPHCHFCGCDAAGELYESRYNPKARICKLCAVDIAAQFRSQSLQPTLDLADAAAIEHPGRTATG
jgi:hypothetical protein